MTDLGRRDKRSNQIIDTLESLNFDDYYQDESKLSTTNDHLHVMSSLVNYLVSKILGTEILVDLENLGTR